MEEQELHCHKFIIIYKEIKVSRSFSGRQAPVVLKAEPNKQVKKTIRYVYEVLEYLFAQQLHKGAIHFAALTNNHFLIDCNCVIFRIVTPIENML